MRRISLLAAFAAMLPHNDPFFLSRQSNISGLWDFRHGRCSRPDMFRPVQGRILRTLKVVKGQIVTRGAA